MDSFIANKVKVLKYVLHMNYRLGLKPMESSADRVYLLKHGFTGEQIEKIYNDINHIYVKHFHSTIHTIAALKTKAESVEGAKQ